MIFKLEFPDKVEYAQAKSLEHLQDEHRKEFGDDFLSCKSVTIITEEVAKTIKLKCVDEPDLLEQYTLFDAIAGENFCIVASTDWD